MNRRKIWKDQGYKGGDFNAAMPFLNSGHEHRVVNIETGEQKTIHVYSNQTLGDAISNGKQWIKDCEENDDFEI